MGPRSATRSRGLRTRIRDAIAVVSALTLLLFGIPLAVVVDRLIQSEALAGLQRDATRGVASVPDNLLESGSQVAAPLSRGSTVIGIYDDSGARVAGRGPSTSGLSRSVSDGREHDGRDGRDLAVVVPVLSDTTVAGSVRAAVPLATLRGRVLQAWALIAALALVLIAVATALARRAARRLSDPFEQITAAARGLGDGQYAIDLPRWNIPEADAAGEALSESAREIDQLVQHERSFVRDASHQLRTPLSAVLLHLGQHPPDVAAALDRAHQLETTIADLLSLRSLAAHGGCNASDVAREAVQRWSRPDRAVSLRTDDDREVALSAAALRQTLDVLLDNAMRHGGGAVTVTVEPHGDAVVVEVADEGPGFPKTSEPGTGLHLATRIVERAGGSLLVRRRAPAARVALLLPASDQAWSTSKR